ncbi:VOC family protein [Elioraea rosea]|uniref:VOC family protein n=1 Tax=Elioraea rosea TaxID=2492390 RepID=UPI00118557EF|nr:VOC family protein [Elioraea rosea]
MAKVQRIATSLWFAGQAAEEAVNFYVSLFADARITETTRWGETGPGTPGSVIAVRFELEGLSFVAINGNAEFPFTPAMSLSVDCETQGEVDRLWDAILAGGGTPMRCGWITDRWGLSWQIVPSVLPKLLAGADRARADRVLKAMMGMVKLDIATLEAA